MDVVKFVGSMLMLFVLPLLGFLISGPLFGESSQMEGGFVGLFLACIIFARTWHNA